MNIFSESKKGLNVTGFKTNIKIKEIDKMLFLKTYVIIACLIEAIILKKNFFLSISSMLYCLISILFQKFKISNIFSNLCEEFIISFIEVFSFSREIGILFVIFFYYISKTKNISNDHSNFLIHVSSKVKVIFNSIIWLCLGYNKIARNTTIVCIKLPLIFACMFQIDNYIQTKEKLSYLEESLTGFFVLKKDKSEENNKTTTLKKKKNGDYNCIYSNNTIKSIFKCRDNDINRTLKEFKGKAIYNDVISKDVIYYKRYTSHKEENDGVIIQSISLGNEKDIKIVSVSKLLHERLAIEQSIYKETKTQLLINILHELNNPITGLLHYAQKILGNVKEDGNQDFIKKMKFHRFQLKQYTKEISMYIKLMLNEIPKIELSNFNLMFIINKLLKKYEYVFGMKNLAFEPKIEINSNIVMYSDYEIFKFLLCNIFTYINNICCNKEKISFEAELKDNKKCQFRFVVNDEEKFSCDETNQEMENFESNHQINWIIPSTIQSGVLNTITDPTKVENPKICKLENNANSLQMSKEIIQKLSSLLNLQTSITNKEIILEFEVKQCESTPNLDCLEKNCYEFSPYTINQNFKNRIRLSRSILSHPFSEKPLSTGQISGINTILIRPSTTSDTSSNNENNSQIPFFADSRYNSNLNVDLDEKGFENIDKYKLKLMNYCSNKSNQSYNDEDDTKSKYLIRPKGKSNSEKFVEKTIFDYSNQLNTKSFFYQQNGSVPTPLSKQPSKNETTLKKSKFGRRKSHIASNLPQISCDCKEIVIVDDEEFIRSTISSVIFKRFGIVSDQCSNGFELIEKIKNELTKKCCQVHYKLLFIDINMPGMGGFSACEHIKNILPQDYNLNIIIISAYAGMDDVQKIIKNNPFVKDFTQKPIKKSLIIDYVSKYVSK